MDTEIYKQILELVQSVGTVALDTLLIQVRLGAIMQLVVFSAVLLCIVYLGIMVLKDSVYDATDRACITFLLLICATVPVVGICESILKLYNPLYYAMKLFASMIN